MTAWADVQARLDAAAAFARELGNKHELQIEVPEIDAQKADFLYDQGRPFIAVTEQMSEQVCEAMQERIIDVYTAGEGLASVFEIFSAGAEAVRKLILSRFDLGGADVSLKPLNPLYLGWKMRHGWPALIGIQTGALRNSIASARITFT